MVRTPSLAGSRHVRATSVVEEAEERGRLETT
jgi:hypothetical protein